MPDLLPKRRRGLVPGRRSSIVPSGRRVLPVSGQIAQDAALAALLGGNLFGRVAMHPALADVSDASERGKVLNRAWRRYGTVNSAALFALVAGWSTSRQAETAFPFTGRGRRALIRAKDVTVGAVVVTGLASAVGGVGFANQASEGAVPMASGNETSDQTPPQAAQIKRAVNVLSGLNLGAEVALVAVNALFLRSSWRHLLTG